MKAFIKSKYDYPEMDVEAAVRHSKGIVGRALELLRDKGSFKARALYIDILEKALTGNGNDAILLASEAIEDKESAESFLEFSLSWFRDIMVLGESRGACDNLIINADSLEVL